MIRSTRGIWRLLILTLALGACKNPAPTTVKAQTTQQTSAELEQGQIQKILTQTDAFILGAETNGIQAVKTSLCALSGDVMPAGGNVLRAIDGVGVQVTVDLARLWAATAKTPMSIKGGVEVVYWFPKDKNGDIERHVYLVPHAGVSTSPGSPVDLDAGIIFGCNGDANAYGGYFGSINAAGFNLNLGLDPGPVFARWFINGLDSKVPGGINDNHPIDFETVNSTIKDKGSKLQTMAAERAGFTSEYPNAAYKFTSTENSEFTMDKIMREVRFKYVQNDGTDAEVEMDFVFKRAIKFVNGLYADGPNNRILVQFDAIRKSVIQNGEDPAFYRQVRMPAVMQSFDEAMTYFWGNPENLSDLRNPVGVQQTMYSISGHFFGTNYNNNLFKAAMNTQPIGTDGEGIGSVKDQKLSEVRKMLFGDGPYSCRRQRERYPESRWFKVYVNQRKMFADCIGYGANELLKEEVSFRIYGESDFEKIQNEITSIKQYFETFEAMRYTVRHGILQLHDSFNTHKDVFKIKTGGIQKPSYLQAFTGCNSISMDIHGAKHAATLGLAAAQDAYKALKTKVASGASVTHALQHIGAHSSVGVNLSYYYHTPLHGHHSAASGWPLIRSIRALKDLDCSVKGVPELEPNMDTPN